MRIAIIGRNEALYNTAQRLIGAGHEIALIVSAKHAPEYTRTVEDFRLLARQLDVPFLRTVRIMDKLSLIDSLDQIDIGVSMNYPGIIPQEVVDVFPLGILNAHPGSLPRYRGNACQAWAILNGEPESGLCIHRMIGGELDSGDIVARDFHPIDLDTKVGELWTWAVDRIPALFEQAVDSLFEDGDYVLERQSLQASDALRCYPRQPGDGRIDWGHSAIEILRLINASGPPYAGAFCYFGSEKAVILNANLFVDDEVYLAVPGQILSRAPGGCIVVATGKGKLQINAIEVANTVISPDEFIKSVRQRLT